MPPVARFVFELLLGIFFPYSMGLLFLDAQVLGMYGVWGMVVARTEGAARAVGEMAALAVLGFVIVNLRLDAPRIVLPLAVTLGGVVLLWGALAWLARAWPAVWLPWLIGAAFWWGPPQIFIPVNLWLMAGALLAVAGAAAKIKNSHAN